MSRKYEVFESEEITEAFLWGEGGGSLAIDSRLVGECSPVKEKLASTEAQLL